MSLVVHTKILLNMPRLRRFALQTGGLLLLCVFAFACSDSDHDSKSTNVGDQIYESDAKVLLLAVDGLDWQLVQPMIDQGRLPQLASLIERGATGRVHTPAQGGTAAHWTTVATGQKAKAHGIKDSAHGDAATSETAPSVFADRKIKAFWNILSDYKIPTSVVGWNATSPADFETFASKTEASTKVKVTETLAAIASASALQPNLSDVRIEKLSAACSADLLNKEFSGAQITKERPRMFALRLSMLDEVGHQFTVNIEADQEAIDRDYGPVQIKAYELMDRWIGEIVAWTDEDTTVMIVSTHGLMMGSHTLHGNGVLVIAGPHVNRGGRVAEHVNLVDITPTLLWIFGLPASEEMKGRVLIDLFEDKFAEPRPAQLVPTYGALAAADDATTPSRTSD